MCEDLIVKCINGHLWLLHMYQSTETWSEHIYCPHFNLPPYSVIAGSGETIKSKQMPGLTLIMTSKRVPPAMLIRKNNENPNNGDKFSRYDGPVCNCFQTNSQYEETYHSLDKQRQWLSPYWSERQSNVKKGDSYETNKLGWTAFDWLYNGSDFLS